MAFQHKRRLELSDLIPINKVEIFNNDVHFSGGGPDTPRTYRSVHDVQGSTHPGYKSTRRNRPRDIGGDVTIIHESRLPYEMDVETHTRAPGTGGVRQSYEGNLVLHDNLLSTSLPTLPSSLPFAFSQMTAMGAKAWADAKPTASRGGIGQALGELRDLPKNPLNALKGIKTNLENLARGNSGGRSIKNMLQGGAGEHLNIQFGILPMVKDIKDLLQNVRDLDKNLDQLRRDNGRPVRRHKKLKGSSTQTMVESKLSPINTGASMVPTLATGFFDGDAQKTVIVAESWDYAFSARFRYYIDWQKADEGNLAAAAQISRMLLGLDVSPSTLYELMPWSWLFDWFFNLGDIVSNITNDQSDHLVADYAYINCKYIKDVTTIIQPKLKNCPNENVVISGVARTEIFKRTHATPYGFGLTFQGFNPKQLGILAALGLTRLL